MAVKYIIRLDDVAKNMHEGNFNCLSEVFEQYNVKPIIGVIPDNQDEELLAYDEVTFDFWKRIRQLQSELGWSVALHGYNHIYTTKESGLLKINNRSEFAGIGYSIQKEMIKKGLDIFKEKGIKADAFMAPSHSYDTQTIEALKDNQLRIITDGYGLFPYKKYGILFVPQLFSKPIQLGFGVYTICLHPNSMNADEIETICDFVKNNSHKIISFEEGKKRIRNGIVFKLFNTLLGVSIICARRLRRESQSDT